MTKADRIRELAKQGKSDAAILQAIVREFGACAPSYVRVCARQRINGVSAHDKAHERKPKRKAYRKWRNKLANERSIANHGHVRSTVNYKRKYGTWSAYRDALAKREVSNV